MNRHLVPALLGAAFLALIASPSSVFALDLKLLQKHLAERGNPWTAGYTEPAIEHEVFGRQYGGPLNLDLSGAEPFVPGKDKAMPAHLDWRDLDGVNYVTKVKNQKNCGSCWAFATTGPIESAVAIAEGWPDPQFDLSEQQLVSCSEGGCNGGFTTTSFDFARDTGLVREECFPYEAQLTACSAACDGWEDQVFKIDSWAMVSLAGYPDAIKAALQEGPVAASLIIYEDFMYYTDGVYEHVDGGYEGMHALTIVGYDDEGQYWIVKNSWGLLWGEHGYGLIKWNAAGIGFGSILPQYTSQNLGPETDDDAAADDDAGDDDGDDTSPDVSDDTADLDAAADDDAAGDDDDDNGGGCGCG